MQGSGRPGRRNACVCAMRQLEAAAGVTVEARITADQSLKAIGCDVISLHLRHRVVVVVTNGSFFLHRAPPSSTRDARVRKNGISSGAPAPVLAYQCHAHARDSGVATRRPTISEAFH